ncbi:DUF488 family protein [Arthrobacter sp. UKPF54-2]|uniref:DUF488 domain-containing protein n=1 Tax=Arthrobacter sp. UKPF54-2 TaxID=2600159 RepID=UPI0011B19D3F|nr:DUF488 family protein [Arthrobacter sp. UKPF54-2]QDY90896.1 DUF488 family protein [Arthrobacter sp. UKPF54-2]
MDESTGNFVIKRIYDEPADDDGYRVLVDRLWPRGVSKDRAQLQLWLKEVAPSAPLRTEFAHMQERFAAFRAAYEAELATNPAVDTLRDLAAGHGKVTLLFGARDLETNHARVLLEFLQR